LPSSAACHSGNTAILCTATKASRSLTLAGGWPGLGLLAVSAVIAAWIAACGGFTFYRDAVVFFDNAEALFHFDVGNYIFTPGYSLLILLTGYLFTQSLVPLLWVQAIFAALTPWLAFRTFLAFDRRAAVAAAAVCLLSLTPFLFEDMFYHDGTFIFCGLLCSSFAAAFFSTGKGRYVYLSLASAVFAYWAQAAMVGFLVAYVGAFAAYAMSNRGQWKHVALAIGMVVALTGAEAAWEEQALGVKGQVGGESGRQLFYHEYLRGVPIVPFAGPAFTALHNALVDHFTGHPLAGDRDQLVSLTSKLGGSYEELFEPWEQHPEAFVDQMFARPVRPYYELMYRMLGLPDGVPDKVFLRASVEYLYRHPLAVTQYWWRNLADFVWGPGSVCKGDRSFPDCLRFTPTAFLPAQLDGVAQMIPGEMPENARVFLGERQGSQGPLMRLAAGWWRIVYGDLRPVLLALAAIGWLASFRGPRGLSWTLGAFLVAYVSTMLVYSLLADAIFRYQAVGVAMLSFVAGQGLWSIVVFASQVCRLAAANARG
jgi:hypothetical protein